MLVADDDDDILEQLDAERSSGLLKCDDSDDSEVSEVWKQGDQNAAELEHTADFSPDAFCFEASVLELLDDYAKNDTTSASQAYHALRHRLGQCERLLQQEEREAAAFLTDENEILDILSQHETMLQRFEKSAVL